MKGYFEMRNWLILLIAVAGALLILGCGADGNGDDATCGNNSIESGEECDGTALGTATCESLGFTGGTIACGDDCKTDSSGCTDVATCDPVCDTAQCMTCEGEQCVTTCADNETCNTGTCEVDLPDCDPACDSSACEVCDDEQCVSTCEDGEVCNDGTCEIHSLNCDPACDSAQCMECDDEQCVSACVDGEICNDGTCEIAPPDCDPACDPDACEICADEQCISTCEDNETCNAGTCEGEPTDCDPACSGETSFCNEIYECVMSECAAEDCTQYDDNLHCDASDEGPGCFCNPGWVLNEERTGCVECEDDDTSNELENPTAVELPLDHTGFLCAWDVFSFDLEAGSTVIIDLVGFEPDVNDLDIYLLLDNVEGITAESSTSGDDFEHIIFTAPEAQTYYLIVTPYSGPMPAEYHLTIRDTCESDEECGGFFAFCNDNDRCEITCEDDGVPNVLDEAEETDLPIEDRSLTICLDNADVFLFTLDAMDTLFVDLTFIHEDGNLDTGLYFGIPEENEDPVAYAQSEDDNESFSYAVQEAGEYYLYIVGDQNNYILNVRTTCETDEECGGEPFVCTEGVCEAYCEEDEACITTFGAFSFCEDNTCNPGECEDDGVGAIAAEATSVDWPIEAEEHTICSEEEDWYVFSAEAETEFFVIVDFIHANLDIDIQLFLEEPTEDSEYIENSAGVSNREEIELMTEETGDYYLRVFGFGDGENTYTLTIADQQCLSSNMCSDGDFCNGDGECSEIPECEEDSDCAELVSIEENVFWFCNTDLDTPMCDIGEGVECEEDGNEPNDEFNAATVMEYPLPDVNDGTTVVPDLMLASDNEDWYKIRKDVGCNLNIDVNFSHADGNLNVYVYESEELMVLSAETEDDNEHIEYTPGGMVFSWYWLKIVTDDSNVCIPYEIIAHYFCG